MSNSMNDKRIIVTGSDDPRALMAGEYEIEEEDAKAEGGWQIVGGFEEFDHAVWGFNSLCAERFCLQHPATATSFALRLRHGGRVLLTGRYDVTISSADA